MGIRSKYYVIKSKIIYYFYYNFFFKYKLKWPKRSPLLILTMKMPIKSIYASIKKKCKKVAIKLLLNANLIEKIEHKNFIRLMSVSSETH